ncbi:hypothetical protein MMC29_001307 [Sticta canariensis]|nr:hypothetical protein [Sticta canariensis]
MRLPLDELTNYLDGAEKQVKTWAQDTTSSASERRKKHSATVQASEASISELKLRRAAYEKQAQELQQRARPHAGLQQEQAAEADELAQLRSVQAENALIPAQLQGLQQLVDRESASLEQSEAGQLTLSFKQGTSRYSSHPLTGPGTCAEIEAQAAEADARLAAVRVELERFRSHLGLHFAYDQGDVVLNYECLHL